MTTIGKSPDGSSRYDKIKKWHKIFTSAAFRKKYNIKIVNEIKRVCFLMHLPKNAEDTAISIYRKARIAKITNGRRFEWIAAASVYASCRVSGFPRSLEEFAAVTQLHPKNIGRVYLVMKRTLHFPVDAVGPSSQVHRIALIAGITPEAEGLAVKLLEKQSYGGKPTTLAATALYIAAVQKGSTCTQSKLARAAGINENTLRNCYQQYKVEMAVS
jgi:transcription initiation factor TFIIB